MILKFLKRVSGFIILITTIIILFSFSGNTKPKKDKKMLLLYAVIDDAVKLNREDTTWIKNDICLKLKIDTVNLLFIDEFKDGKRIYYDGNIYNKNQLFDLESGQYLTSYKIEGFTISCTGAAFEPPYVSSDSECVSNQLRYYLREYYKASRDYKEKKYTIYFHDIKALNSIDKKVVILNQISCKIR